MLRTIILVLILILILSKVTGLIRVLVQCGIVISIVSIFVIYDPFNLSYNFNIFNNLRLFLMNLF